MKGTSTMKITKTQLKKLIKEELEASMEEEVYQEGVMEPIYSGLERAMANIRSVPGVMATGLTLGLLMHQRPRPGITPDILGKNLDMMRAIVANFGTGGSVSADVSEFLGAWKASSVSAEAIIE